jgi:hypothetical protein
MRLAEHAADHGLGDGADLGLGQEGGLDVDLRELGLAVGAQVLVAEALGDLVVAVEAGHHQQLLEQLRALRQREELAVVHAAGHQVVARAFGRALGEHGRLDVDEALLVQELAHLDGHAVAQAQVLLHLGAAQVQHAVRQAHGLRQVLVVQRERRRDAGVEHHQFVAQHLDLAAGEVGVFGAGRARAHLAHDLQAELVAHAFGDLEHLGAVGVADDLHQAFAVAQVDEDHAAMVAAAVGPAHQGDGLVHQRFADQAAVGGSHGFTPNGKRSCLKKDRGGDGAAGAHCLVVHGPIDGLAGCRAAPARSISGHGSSGFGGAAGPPPRPWR